MRYDLATETSVLEEVLTSSQRALCRGERELAESMVETVATYLSLADEDRQRYPELWRWVSELATQLTA